ncbi:MAG: hypothetical protein ACM674_03660, partial [Bacteroidales bacterium]
HTRPAAVRARVKLIAQAHFLFLLSHFPDARRVGKMRRKKEKKREERYKQCPPPTTAEQKTFRSK